MLLGGSHKLKALKLNIIANEAFSGTRDIGARRKFNRLAVRGGGKRKRDEYERYDYRVDYPVMNGYPLRKRRPDSTGIRRLTTDFGFPSDHSNHTDRMKRALMIAATWKRMQKGDRGVKRKARAL